MQRLLFSALATIAAANPLLAQCAPARLVRVVIRDQSPGAPPDSFQARPKTIFRLGATFARIEEMEDKENGIHGLVVVNSPDSWMVNLYDGTGRHVVDPDPEGKVHVQLLNADMLDGALPAEFFKLEIGCEVAFFNDRRSPIATLKTPEGDKVKQAVGLGKWKIVLVRQDEKGPPEMLFLFRDDDIVAVWTYVSYEELVPPDMKLFSKPSGVKFVEPS